MDRNGTAYSRTLNVRHTQSDFRDQRYRTEPDIRISDTGLKRAESVNISDINFFPISNIRYQILKGVCHETFWVLFWHLWIDLGLYKNL
jgi:hypothetical protein